MRYLLVAILLLTACTPRIEKSIAAADALRGTQQYTDALQAYDAIVGQHADDARVPDVLLRIGDLYAFNLKQSEPAQAVYRRIAARWPRLPVAVTVYLRLADLAENAEDRPGVIEPLEYLLRYFPTYPDRLNVRRRIALQYLQMKSYEQARVELQTLLDEELPAEFRAQVLLDMADTYLLPKRPAAALRWLQRAIDAAPDSEYAARARKTMLDVRVEAGDHSALAAAAAPDESIAAAPQTEKSPAWPAAMTFARGTVVVTPMIGPTRVVHVEVAATAAERDRGLMFRSALASDAGMWFVFPEPTRAAFWMKNTMLALDLLFVDADGRVVDIIANTTPYSEKPLQPQLAYQAVLEVNAGYAAREHITVGAHIHLQ